MTTTLNGTTVTDPFEINIEFSYLGTTKRAANGTIINDYLYNAVQRKITMNWRLITGTERDTIVAKCKQAMVSAVPIVIPDGRTITAWFPADNPIVETQVRSSGTYLFNIQVTFLEELQTS